MVHINPIVIKGYVKYYYAEPKYTVNGIYMSDTFEAN